MLQFMGSQRVGHNLVSDQPPPMGSAPDPESESKGRSRGIYNFREHPK